MHTEMMRMREEEAEVLIEHNANEQREEAAADHPIEEDDEVHCMNNLTKISNLLQAKPKNLLRLQPTEDGVRGVYLNRPVREGDIIFSIPLSSCLTDDAPPSWFTAKDVRHNPNKWATRLSASLIDLQLRKQEGLLDEGMFLILQTG